MVAWGKPADGRGSEPDKRLTAIRRITLEVAVQPSLALRNRKLVLRQREMIEPDPFIARLNEAFGDRFRLCVARLRIGQRRFVAQPLEIGSASCRERGGQDV